MKKHLKTGLLFLLSFIMAIAYVPIEAHVGMNPDVAQDATETKEGVATEATIDQNQNILVDILVSERDATEIALHVNYVVTSLTSSLPVPVVQEEGMNVISIVVNGAQQPMSFTMNALNLNSEMTNGSTMPIVINAKNSKLLTSMGVGNAIITDVTNYSMVYGKLVPNSTLDNLVDFDSELGSILTIYKQWSFTLTDTEALEMAVLKIPTSAVLCSVSFSAPDDAKYEATYVVHSLIEGEAVGLISAGSFYNAGSAVNTSIILKGLDTTTAMATNERTSRSGSNTLMITSLRDQHQTTKAAPANGLNENSHNSFCFEGNASKGNKTNKG